MDSMDAQILHGQFRTCLWIKVLWVCPFGVLRNPLSATPRYGIFPEKVPYFLSMEVIILYDIVSCAIGVDTMGNMDASDGYYSYGPIIIKCQPSPPPFFESGITAIEKAICAINFSSRCEKRRKPG